MAGLSIDVAVVIGLIAAVLALVILAVRSVEWLGNWQRSSAESRLILAHRLMESWSTPLALAPIVEARRQAQERDYP